MRGQLTMERKVVLWLTQKMVRLVPKNILFFSERIERDMDICRPKDHKRWSRPSFCGLSGYEPKIWHPGLLGRASCTIRAVPGSNPGHFTTKSCLFSSVRTPDMPKQKCCLFSSVRTPDITQQQNQLPGCFLVLQHHFLSFSASTLLRKKDSRCKGGERDMDICRQKGPQTMVETILLWSVIAVVKMWMAWMR